MNNKDNSTGILMSGVQLAVSYLKRLRTRRKKRRESCVLIDAAIDAANSGFLDTAVQNLERTKYCATIVGEELGLLEAAITLLQEASVAEETSVAFKIVKYLYAFLLGRFTLHVWMMIQNNIQLSLISFSQRCSKYQQNHFYGQNVA